jgi:hypothetical protein
MRHSASAPSILKLQRLRGFWSAFGCSTWLTNHSSCSRPANGFAVLRAAFILALTQYQHYLYFTKTETPKIGPICDTVLLWLKSYANQPRSMPSKRAWSQVETEPNSTSPASRPRPFNAAPDVSMPLVSRKVKACASCRKQKVWHG